MQKLQMLDFYPVNPEWVSKAREFLVQKWSERAHEKGRPEPTDLSTACKFSSLFVQKVFGGTIKGNYEHQFNIVPNGKEIDLTGGTSRAHDPQFFGNPEHRESMESCLPRVVQWVKEFKSRYPLQAKRAAFPTGTGIQDLGIEGQRGWSYDGYLPDRHNDFFENVENPHSERGDEAAILETGAVVPEEPRQSAMGEVDSGNSLVRPMASKEAAVGRDPHNCAIWKGKRFYMGVADSLDGLIEEVHTYEEAKDANLHHSEIFSDEATQSINYSWHAAMFIVEPNRVRVIDRREWTPGESREVTWSEDPEIRESLLKHGLVSKDIESLILKQIKFVTPNAAVRLSGLAEFYQGGNVKEAGELNITKTAAVLPSEYVYHNTTSEALKAIEAEGLDAGSFSDRPGEFFGDVWLAVRKEDLPPFQEHQYGGLTAYEPAWEGRTVPPERIYQVTRQGRIIRQLGGKTASQRGVWYHGTIPEAAEKIREQGLVPPSKQPDFPGGAGAGHVYFSTLKGEALDWGWRAARRGKSKLIALVAIKPDKDLEVSWWNSKTLGSTESIIPASSILSVEYYDAKKVAEAFISHKPLPPKTAAKDGEDPYLSGEGWRPMSQVKTAAQRGIWYHGSSIKNLESILHQGLVPVEDPERKNWGSDPDAGIKPSRESYGGIYVTTNLMTAATAPRDHNEEGREVVVCMELQPSTFYLDEDDINFYLEEPLQNSSSIARYVFSAYLAASSPESPRSLKGDVNGWRDAFTEDAIRAWKFKWREGEEKDTMHPGMEERLRALLPEMWLASVTRLASWMGEKTQKSEYYLWDYQRAYRDVHPEVDYDQIPPVNETIPPHAEGEKAFMRESERITRTLRQFAAPKGKPWHHKDTARVATPIGYSGSNRILAVVEVRDGRAYREGVREDFWNVPVRMIVHYGELPADFFSQYRERYGSSYVVERAPQPGKVASFEKVALNIPRLVKDFGPSLLKRYRQDEGSAYPGSPEDLINFFLIHYDPTANHEYTAWITGNYARGELGRFEDFKDRLAPLIERYHRLKLTKKLKLEDRDLARYRGLPALEKLLERYADVEALSKRDKEKEFFTSGAAELMHDDARIKVVIPKTQEASDFFGINTKWCTTSAVSGAFPQYAEKGPLYIILFKKENRRFQFHFQSAQFTDETDKPLNIREWLMVRPEVARLFWPIAQDADARCEDCEGEGTIMCGNCGGGEGTVECDTCDGHGTVACGECDGNGKVRCSKCDGTGDLHAGEAPKPCPACRGKGTEKCPVCEGKGSVRSEAGGPRTCKQCSGTGEEDCPICGGVGETSAKCEECKGTGSTKCWTCGGDLTVACGDCNGDGQVECGECEGSGTAMCEECRGTGQNQQIYEFLKGCQLAGVAGASPAGKARNAPEPEAPPPGAQPPVPPPMEEYQANMPHPLDPLALQKIRQASETAGPHIEARQNGTTVWLDWFEMPSAVRGRGLGRTEYAKWESGLPKDVRLVRLFAGNVEGMPSEGFWEKMGYGYVFPEGSGQYDPYMWKGVNGNPTPEPLEEAPDDDGSYDIEDEPEAGTGSVAKTAAGEWWRKWRKTMVLPKGTTLYHGTGQQFPANEISMPAWFSTSRSVVEHFIGWHKGEDDVPRTLEYKVVKPIRLPRIDSKKDFERLAEMYGEGFLSGAEDQIDAVLAAHLPGWIIPHNYKGDGDDILLVDDGAILPVDGPKEPLEDPGLPSTT